MTEPKNRSNSRLLTGFALVFVAACGAEATEVGIDCTINAQCFFPDVCTDGRCTRPEDPSDGGTDAGFDSGTPLDSGLDSGFDAGSDACTVPLPVAGNAFDMGCSFVGVGPGESPGTLAFQGRVQTGGLCPGAVQSLGEILVSNATFSGSILNACRLRRVIGMGSEIHFFGGTRTTGGSCDRNVFIGKVDVAGALVSGEARAGCTFRGIRASGQTIEFLRNSRGPSNECGDFPQESAGTLTLEPTACF